MPTTHEAVASGDALYVAVGGEVGECLVDRHAGEAELLAKLRLAGFSRLPRSVLLDPSLASAWPQLRSSSSFVNYPIDEGSYKILEDSSERNGVKWVPQASKAVKSRARPAFWLRPSK